MATVTCGLAERLRALRAFGLQVNAKRSRSRSHTPQTGMAWGRASADAVTTQ